MDVRWMLEANPTDTGRMKQAVINAPVLQRPFQYGLNGQKAPAQDYAYPDRFSKPRLDLLSGEA